jgi:hypothetical protein
MIRPKADPWQVKTDLGGIPIAPIEALTRVYGKAVRRMSRSQFLTYCQERSSLTGRGDRGTQ